MASTRFDWDSDKDAENQQKHGVPFIRAQYAFADPRRVIARDVTHSKSEERFYCFGDVDGGCPHGAVHLSSLGHSNHRSRLLAKRKGSL